MFLYAYFMLPLHCTNLVSLYDRSLISPLSYAQVIQFIDFHLLFYWLSLPSWELDMYNYARNSLLYALENSSLDSVHKFYTYVDDEKVYLFLRKAWSVENCELGKGRNVSKLNVANYYSNMRTATNCNT